MCPGEVGLFNTQLVEAHEHFSQKTENHVLILKPSKHLWHCLFCQIAQNIASEHVMTLESYINR